MNSPPIDGWEQLLDIDDSDLRLSATTQYTVSEYASSPPRRGIVQAAKIRKTADIQEGVASMTQEYIKKFCDEGEDHDFKSGPWIRAVEFFNADGGTLIGVFADIPKYLQKGKLENVVAIIKSCTPNVLGDLTVTLKDVSGLISGTIHHKVLSDEHLAKELTVGTVLILKNVSVFSPKQSGNHYLNITIRNVLKVFSKDAVLSVTV